MLPFIFLSLLIAVGANPSGCPTNETCCPTNNGLWSSCPMKDGVCCNDDVYCCSKGEICLTNGKCSSSTNEISFAFPLKLNENQLTSIICPDGSACDNSQTCCELSSSQYACCPLPDAVCCNDHIHCCPKAHTCDIEHGRCGRQIDRLNYVPCPGGQTACPDGYTCCKTEGDDYGCCPLPDAVCCSDHRHCCPHGKVCDTEHARCADNISIPWFVKTPAIRRNQQLTKIVNPEEIKVSLLNLPLPIDTDIICPDATSLCDSESTCCLTPSSVWGCCPVENAVCCSDHIHCCPTHYKCDLHVFKCDHDLFGSTAMIKKEISLKKVSLKITKPLLSISIIQCPDGNYCPDETTCCELETGKYGCCPHPQGSCCSDKIHCCGNGYSCDESGKRCIRHFNSLNRTDIISSDLKLKSFKKEKLIRYSPREDQLCPDGKLRCSLNSTCCPNKDKNPLSYSCCPYSKGVCCGSNGSVCCPNNYDCNEDQLSCELRDSIGLRNILLTEDYYQCDSSDVYCSVGQTCCDTNGSSNKDFACCPYSNAQCCEDGAHCCPAGSNCDSLTGGCL